MPDRTRCRVERSSSLDGSKPAAARVDDAPLKMQITCMTEPNETPIGERQSDLEKIVSAIHAVEQQLDENSPKKKTDRCWARASALGLWAAAAVGLTAVVVSSHDSRLQYHTMMGQLGEMKAQRLVTTAQMRANLRRERPQLLPIGNGGKLIGVGEKMTDIAVSPNWTNVGSTNAQDYRGWFDLQVHDLQPKQIVTASDCPPIGEPRALSEGTVVEPGRNILQAAQKFSVQDAIQARDDNKYILMRGHIQYRDIFPDTPAHHDDWCVVIVPNNLEKMEFSFPIVREKAD